MSRSDWPRSAFFHIRAVLAQMRIYPLLTNIWFLRTAVLASGAILSSLLLAYSLIFLKTYMILGNTTSYFPWSWDVLYTSSGSVQGMFNEVVESSLLILIGCTISLVYCFPRFLQSIGREKILEIFSFS